METFEAHGNIELNIILDKFFDIKAKRAFQVFKELEQIEGTQWCNLPIGELGADVDVKLELIEFISAFLKHKCEFWVSQESAMVQIGFGSTMLDIPCDKDIKSIMIEIAPPGTFD